MTDPATPIPETASMTIADVITPAAASAPHMIFVHRCAECGSHPKLAKGADVCPDEPDLHERNAYVCTNPDCRAYVFCAPDSIRPHGSPAGPALRQARKALHDEVLKPLAKTLPLPSVRRMALVHAYMSRALHLPAHLANTGLFDLSTIGHVRSIFSTVTAATLVAWHEAGRPALTAYAAQHKVPFRLSKVIDPATGQKVKTAKNPRKSAPAARTETARPSETIEIVAINPISTPNKVGIVMESAVHKTTPYARPFKSCKGQASMPLVVVKKKRAFVVPPKSALSAPVFPPRAAAQIEVAPQIVPAIPAPAARVRHRPPEILAQIAPSP